MFACVSQILLSIPAVSTSVRVVSMSLSTSDPSMMYQAVPDNPTWLPASTALLKGAQQNKMKQASVTQLGTRSLAKRYIRSKQYS